MGHARGLVGHDPTLRRNDPPADRPTAENGPGASDPLSARSLLDLQRRAGNAVVARLVGDGSARPGPGRTAARTVQRRPKPLSADADPEGYTQETGKANVRGTGLTRLEVRDLEMKGDKGPVKLGVSGGFQDAYTPGRSSEKQMTDESPDNMAVVIMPKTIDPKAHYQVILHFHGWGFRQWKEGTDPYDARDPYAGYTVASGRTASKKGTVRDVDQEHWEQQIKGVMDTRGAGQPPIIAVLAQGRGNQDFGNVPTYAYIQSVFQKAGIGVTQFSVVLSGHSGGGSVLADKVAGGDAAAVDPTTLPKGSPRAASPGAADLVVFFDAEGIVATSDVMVRDIRALGAALDKIDKEEADAAKAEAAKAEAAAKADTSKPDAPKPDPAKAEAAKAEAAKAAAKRRAARIQAVLTAATKYRGYFAKGGNYVIKFNKAAWNVKQALDALDAKWTTLTPGVLAVPDLFRFVEVDRPGVSHEHLIGAFPVKSTDPAKAPDESVGALADALNVTTDPTRDRGDTYRPTKPKPPPAPKAKAKP